VAIGEHRIYCLSDGYDIFVSDINATDDFYEVNITMAAICSVMGVVYHAIDGPLENVRVTLGDYTVFSDNEGHYDFPSIPEGTHEIRCYHPDYDEYVDTVVIAYSQSLPSIRMLKTVTNVELSIDNDLSMEFERGVFSAVDCNEPDGQATNLFLAFYWMGTADFGHDWLIYSMLYLKPESEIFGNIVRAESVNLSLCKIDLYGETDVSCLKVEAITEPWDESTFTCENLPAISSTDYICVDIPPRMSENPMVIDITELMNMNPNPFYGFRLSVSGYLGGPTLMCYICSSENENAAMRPKITGTFTY